jgi:hypothetical protein
MQSNIESEFVRVPYRRDQLSFSVEQVHLPSAASLASGKYMFVAGDVLIQRALNNRSKQNGM